MIIQSSELSFQNPHGYQIQGQLLQEFEHGLDPLNPQSSRIPCHVLGYGEISTVFEIQVEGLQDLAFKRMCCFETPDELKPYVETYLVYNQILENQVELHLPPHGYAMFTGENVRPVFYIIQQRLLPASIGNNALQLLSPQQIISLFRLVLLELHKVWALNRSHPACQVGIDGQISNWAIENFGLEATADLCAGINEVPPLTLRANTLKASRGELMAAISPFAAKVAPTAAAPDGITVSGLKTPLRDLPAFRHGWFQVQDEAAQLVTLLLNPQPEETVLDGCAGRGGKTAHIAQLMQDRGRLVALDQSNPRLSQLRDEMQRLGISVVAVCEANLLQSNACARQEPFDRILLDAPCSGLGTLRRNPDIKWSAYKKDLQRYHSIQLRMLRQVSGWLKPRGIMVYAVCSAEFKVLNTDGSKCRVEAVKNGERILSCTGPSFAIVEIEVCEIPELSEQDLAQCSVDSTYNAENQCCVAQPADKVACTTIKIQLKGCAG